MYKLLSLFSLVLFLGCQAQGSRQVSDAFFLKYYVDADLQGAQGLASGAALVRVKDEIMLRTGQNLSVGKRQRKVVYRHMGAKNIDSNKQIHAYNFEIDTGEIKLNRKSMITVTRINHRWLVSFFREID